MGRQLLLFGVPALATLLVVLALDLGPAGSVLLIVFVASFVAVLRERPSLKHFGPLLLVWGLAMLMLIFIRDLGSSLMFFGGFLALLYVATGRLSLVGVGATMFLGGATFFAGNVSHVRGRIDTWLDTFSTRRGVCPSTGEVTEFVNCQGYQIAQSLFAQADGGLFGQGFGRALLDIPGGGRLIPAAHTDLIYSVFVNEVGLFGAAGLIGAYLLLVFRGFKTALLAADGFSKLLATGLTAVLALQVFVIVGGVTRVIPLTGVTLPFVSYGGSSIVANMVLLALLLIVSEKARSETPAKRRPGLMVVAREPPDRPAVRALRGALRPARGLHLALDGVRGAVARRQPEQPPAPHRGAADPARAHLRPRRRDRARAQRRRGPRAEPRVHERTYPQQGLFAHPIGYSFITNGRRSLELSRNEDLAGEEDEFESLFAGLEGREREGLDVVTNLDVAGTQAAVAGLAGRKGSVVAIEPQTGKVRVMVSIPEYDPNLIPSDIGTLERDAANQPLLNRSTQELYPPGSTFKVVTAAAAMDSGKVNPDSVIDGSSPREISGVPLANSGNQSFGPISFTDALTNSVNTVFAQVGEQVGRDTLVEYMKRFGFYEDPELDYPNFQMIPSGIINGDGDYVSDGFDAGRVAIGQGGLEGEIRASPMQMALVAAAIGNRGRLMQPRLTDSVVRKDGRVKERVQPDLQSQVVKPEVADQLAQMMGRVVEEGTGTAAALAGVPVAGKTGTRRGGRQPRVHPALVHRVRADRGPADGDRRDRRAPARRVAGRHRGRADRPSSVLQALLGGGG